MMPRDLIAESLRDRKADLMAELERLTAPPAQSAGVSFGKRVGDGTTEAVERLATTATARSLSASIRDIDAALAKIADGTYGVCETCGDSIGETRLEALPATIRCIACATSR